MLNNTRQVRMTTATTTPRRAGYELLLKRNHHRSEHHYCSSEVEIMEPDSYGGMINGSSMAANVIGPSSMVSSIPTAPPSISSSTTANYEFNSTSRRYPSKQRPTPCSSMILPSAEVQDGRIEVKILPQDDNWGETTTITCNGANEDTLTNNNDISLHLDEHHLHPTNSYQHLPNPIDPSQTSIKLCHWAVYVLCFIAFVSPVLFLTLPYALNGPELISIDDYTLLLSIIFKLLLLLFGTFLLFYRRRNTTHYPRIHLPKIFLTILLITILFTYWIYYIFQLLLPTDRNYEQIFSMTSTYEDLLLLYLLLTVLIFEVKWLYPKWIVKVVRSPDGLTRQYTIGSMSIQEASIYLLEQYYKDFPVFNPWLENAQHAQSKRNAVTSNKSIGSQSNASTLGCTTTNTNKQISNGDLRRSARTINDRFYDELDYERRVRKRRTKLLSSCEEAFTHVRKCFNEKYGSNIPMDSREAAQAVFSSMSRALQKYLRITRQQPYFTRESIISHLSTCLSYDLSSRAFLERYTQIESQPLATLLFPALGSTKDYPEQSWTITCDPQSSSNENEETKSRSINRSITSNLVIVLKQQYAEHIALICTFHAMPKVHLLEKFFDLKQNKFVLKLNSETSV